MMSSGDYARIQAEEAIIKAARIEDARVADVARTAAALATQQATDIRNQYMAANVNPYETGSYGARQFVVDQVARTGISDKIFAETGIRPNIEAALKDRGEGGAFGFVGVTGQSPGNPAASRAMDMLQAAFAEQAAIPQNWADAYKTYQDSGSTLPYSGGQVFVVRPSVSQSGNNNSTNKDGTSKYGSIATRDVTGQISGYTPTDNFTYNNPLGAAYSPIPQYVTTPPPAAPAFNLLDRADYIQPQNIGDSGTQARIAAGMTPEQALNDQMKGTTGRKYDYYNNELDKMAQSNAALSSAIHNWGMASGRPQAPNFAEYVGDLSVGYLKGYEGKSGARVISPTNVDVLGLPGGYGSQDYSWERAKGNMIYGDFTQAVDVISAAKKSGEMGAYGNLGFPTMNQAGERTRFLSLAEQQGIGLAGWSTRVLVPPPPPPSTGKSSLVDTKTGTTSVTKSINAVLGSTPNFVRNTNAPLKERGVAYETAVYAERTGGNIGKELYADAVEQGFVPGGGSFNVIGDMSVIPSRDLSSGMGGKNVPTTGVLKSDYDKVGDFGQAIGYHAWMDVPGVTMLLPIGDEGAFQKKTDVKFVYSPGGAFVGTELLKSNQEGFVRLFPTNTFGGGDNALQSGMFSGKAQSPMIYDSYGMTPLWDKSQQALINDMQRNPQNYSQGGSELYGKVSLLDGRTLQGEFLKGNTTMSGRYAQDSMNYALLPGLLSNVAKKDTGTQFLPGGASLTFATDPAIQRVNATTGAMTGIYPDWTPIKQNIIPQIQPDMIMFRPEPIPTVYRQAPEPSKDASTKFQNQFGGYIINAPTGTFDVGTELKENAKYNANAAEMFADYGRNPKFQTQTWMEPQPWQWIKNPKAGQFVDPTLEALRVLQQQPAVVAAPARIAGGADRFVPTIQIKPSRSDFVATSPMGVEIGMKEGSIPKPFRAPSESTPAYKWGTPEPGATYEYRKDVQAVALEGAVYFGDQLVSEFGWTPGADMIERFGQNKPDVVGNAFIAEQTTFKSQQPKYDALGLHITANENIIASMTKGKINADNQFTGTADEFSRLMGVQTDLNADVADYNAYWKRGEGIVQKGYSTGAIVPLSGGSYIMNPDNTKTKYGAFDEYTRYIALQARGGAKESDIAKYEASPEFKNSGLWNQFGEGSWKAITDPKRTGTAFLKGVEYYAGFGGASAIFGSFAPAAGVLPTGALETTGYIGRGVMDSRTFQYGLAGAFGTGSVLSATENFTAPPERSTSNIGGVVIDLTTMMIGGTTPESLSRGNAYAAVRFEVKPETRINIPAGVTTSSLMPEAGSATLGFNYDVPYTIQKLPSVNIFGYDITFPRLSNLRETSSGVLRPENAMPIEFQNFDLFATLRDRNSAVSPGFSTTEFSGTIDFFRGEGFGRANLETNTGALVTTRPMSEYINEGIVTARQQRMGRYTPANTAAEITHNLVMLDLELATPQTAYQRYFKYTSRGVSLENSISDMLQPLTHTDVGVDYQMGNVNIFDSATRVSSENIGTDARTNAHTVVERSLTNPLEGMVRTDMTQKRAAINLLRQDAAGIRLDSNEFWRSFDAYGNPVARVEGTPYQVTTDKLSVQENIIAGENVAYAHAHTNVPFSFRNLGSNMLGDVRELISNPRNVRDIVSYSRTEAAIRSMWEGSMYYESPSYGDFGAASRNNDLVSFEAIVNAEGTLVYTKPTRGWSQTFEIARDVGTAQDYFVGGNRNFFSDYFRNFQTSLESRGGSVEYIPHNRIYTEGELTSLITGDVSARMENSLPMFASRGIRNAADRFVIGDQLLNFVPQPRPATSVRGGYSGLIGVDILHAQTTRKLQESKLLSTEPQRIASTPNKNAGRARSSIPEKVRAAGIIPATQTAPNFNIGKMSGIIPAQTKTAKQSSSQSSLQQPRQVQGLDMVRAIRMGSDAQKYKQEQEKRYETIRVVSMTTAQQQMPQTRSRDPMSDFMRALTQTPAAAQRTSTNSKQGITPIQLVGTSLFITPIVPIIPVQQPKIKPPEPRPKPTPEPKITPPFTLPDFGGWGGQGGGGGGQSSLAFRETLGVRSARDILFGSAKVNKRKRR